MKQTIMVYHLIYRELARQMTPITTRILIFLRAQRFLVQLSVLNKPLLGPG